MGAYMARPSTEKNSDSGFTDWITYGVSSMQGWRMQQEDAHNCEPEFDPSRFASLFAVYDGHGGSEVARYCAAYLPAFLKNLPTYATDDPAEVLKQLFVDFDASLVTPEARAILHSLAEKNEKQSEDEIDASDDTDEDGSDSEISALREEANEPLESVLERYGGEDALPTNIKDLLVRRRKVKAGECSNTQAPESAVNSVDRFDSPDRGTFTPGDKNHNEIHGSTEALENGLNEAKANKNGGTDEDEDDDSEDEDVELTGDADEDASSTEDSEDTADDDEEDEDEDETIRGLRLGVPSALKDQDDSEPGVDSGTTACVALLLPYNGIVKLFVANAGDSRAVLCRGTVAIDLSVDHKPEDEDEKSRITAAGGTVTRDGRVNGGLNLSRALGDHSYKQAQGLPLAVQMITPSPDVTQFDLIPGSDQFLVIACDGVWNSMTSQEVVDFVRERLQSKLDTKGDERLTPTSDRESDAITLSKICEEIFDHCLAPNTDGDGTGCDNMTCIIVRFDNLEGLARRSLESSCNLANVRKRAAADEKIYLDEAVTTVDEFNTITSSKRIRSDVPPLDNSAIKTGVTNGDCI